jgi:hypothetical protein
MNSVLNVPIGSAKVLSPHSHLKTRPQEEIVLLPAIPVLVGYLVESATETIPDYILGTVLYFVTGTPYSGWNTLGDFFTNLIPGWGELRTTKKIGRIVKAIDEFMALAKRFGVTNVDRVAGKIGNTDVLNDLIATIKSKLTFWKNSGSKNKSSLIDEISRVFNGYIGFAYELQIVKKFCDRNGKSFLSFAMAPTGREVLEDTFAKHFVLGSNAIKAFQDKMETLMYQLDFDEYTSVLDKLDYANYTRGLTHSLTDEFADFVRKEQGRNGGEKMIIGEIKTGGNLVGYRSVDELIDTDQKLGRSIVNKLTAARAAEELSEGSVQGVVEYFFKNENIDQGFINDLIRLGDEVFDVDVIVKVNY